MSTWAVRHNDTVYVNQDVAAALCGKAIGYRVTLHDKPRYTFIVAADTGDAAVRAALQVARENGLVIARTGATFQRVSGATP